MPQKELKRHVIAHSQGRSRSRYDAASPRARAGACCSVNPRKNTVIVEHAHLIKRHTRPNPAKNIKGGIVEREAPINVSNVLIVCSNCNKHARIGHNVLPDGSKVRVCKRCGTTLDK